VNEADALRIANETRFGLARRSGAKTQSVPNSWQHIFRPAALSSTHGQVDPRLPFGGVKASGYGRELSRLGYLNL